MRKRAEGGTLGEWACGATGSGGLLLLLGIALFVPEMLVFILGETRYTRG